jgi:predicted metal-dependent HD superfamily phosphohydrolase
LSSTATRNNIKNILNQENFEHLYYSWMRLCKELSIGDYHAWQYFSIIRDFYSQTWRKYHNLSHIYRYINSIIAHKDKLNDIKTVLLSAWFHDIIYTPSRNDNEEVIYYNLSAVLNYLKNLQKILV